MNSKRVYFNELAARWDQIPAMEDAPRKIRRFVERACVAGARRILDVGCGTGVLLAGIGDTAWVVEVDFAERMLQENARKFATARVERGCADAARLPFAAGCFDLVLCFGVLPHIEDLEGALAGLLVLLRPGGALSVGHLLGSRELNAFHGSLDGPIVHDRLPSAAALAETLERLGAAVSHAEEDSNWYFVRAEWPGCWGSPGCWR
jgi:SAM-dependent methyltransferase